MQTSFLTAKEPIKRPDSAGSKGNRIGRIIEQTLQRYIQLWGYEVEHQKKLHVKSVLGKNIQCDLFIVDFQDFPDGLIIESRWQASSGSADEKFVKLVTDIKKKYPCPTIIVYLGGAIGDGVVTYLRNQVDGMKLIGAFTLEEFLKWFYDRI